MQGAVQGAIAIRPGVSLTEASKAKIGRGVGGGRGRYYELVIDG